MLVSQNSRLITRQYSVSDRNLFYIQFPVNSRALKGDINNMDKLELQKVANEVARIS